MSMLTFGHSKAIFFAIIAFAVSGVSGCSERNDFEVRETNTVYPYRSASPHVGVLKKCVLVGTVAQSCSLNELPLIGDGVTTPTVDQIMERVLVTHHWMGVRFEQVLRDSPDSLLTLFSSSTAVLIGSKIRPSFYTTLNGAIQLDPVYLWTTLDEKSSISRAEDFRSDFGKDLQFWFLSDLVKSDGSRLAPFFSLHDDSVRTTEDIKIPLQRLLFHELVHATDYIPRNTIAGLNPNLSIYESIDNNREQWLSTRLQALNPLNSDTLREFAKVRYRGNAASPMQKSANSIEMGALMSVDGAVKFYSYTSPQEDLALLVEGVMMGHHFDSLTNVGFTQKPLNEDSYTCNDLLVDWGQRNRLADPLVSVRARVATELVADITPALTTFMESGFGDAELMTNKVHWCNNQKSTGASATDIQARSVETVDAHLSDTQFREMIHSDSIVHPDGYHHD